MILLFVAVSTNEAHEDRRSLVDQQAVHRLLDLFLIQGRWGIHIRVVLSCQVRPPPIGAAGLQHMRPLSQQISETYRERQDLSSMYLAHHELESVFVVIIFVIIIISIIIIVTIDLIIIIIIII